MTINGCHVCTNTLGEWAKHSINLTTTKLFIIFYLHPYKHAFQFSWSHHLLFHNSVLLLCCSLRTSSHYMLLLVKKKNRVNKHCTVNLRLGTDCAPNLIILKTRISKVWKVKPSIILLNNIFSIQISWLIHTFWLVLTVLKSSGHQMQRWHHNAFASFSFFII